MFSPDLDFQSNTKSLDLSDEILQKKKKKKKDGTQVFSQGAVRPVRCLLALWLGGLGDGAAEWFRSVLPACSYRRN